MKQVVKEYYQTHRLSFKRISDESYEIFGEFVSIDQIKKWSQEDGGWKKLEINEDRRLQIIADRIFEAIEDNDDLSPRDLTSLAQAYLQLATKAPVDVAGRKPTLQEIIDAVKNDNVDTGEN